MPSKIPPQTSEEGHVTSVNESQKDDSRQLQEETYGFIEGLWSVLMNVEISELVKDSDPPGTHSSSTQEAKLASVGVDNVEMKVFSSTQTVYKSEF